MSIFSKNKDYRSDTTNFIEEMKKRDPLLEEKQRQGRAIFWDKGNCFGVVEKNNESRVAQKPYVYQPDGQ